MEKQTDSTPDSITHFNKEAFKDCNRTLSSLNLASKRKLDRVKKEIPLSGFYDLAVKSESIIEAIQIIAYADPVTENDNRLSVINDLATFLRALIPFDEMEFLDNLFLDPTEKASNLINIENL